MSSEDEVTPVAHEGNPSDEGGANSSGGGGGLVSTVQEDTGEGGSGEVCHVDKTAGVDSVPSSAV